MFRFSPPPPLIDYHFDAITFFARLSIFFAIISSIRLAFASFRSFHMFSIIAMPFISLASPPYFDAFALLLILIFRF
jgi:hypothetical protein